MLIRLIQDLKESSNKEHSEISQKFFKTKKGEYGEGDIFLGIKVPVQRKIAKKYFNLKLDDLQKLLNSKIHEERFTALIILNAQYKKSDSENKKIIFDFYIRNAKNINNWDLVDVSSPNIVGDFLLDKEKEILYNLAKSENLWEKRIAIVSTFAFIRKNNFEDTLFISEILLRDSHDLIHKAVGWMLREVGKKDENILRNFLKQNYEKLPRTTLRYAIEKFDEAERKNWLKGNFNV